MSRVVGRDSAGVEAPRSFGDLGQPFRAGTSGIDERVASKRHGGCANGGCPEVVVAEVTACPDSLLSRWDDLAEGRGRYWHTDERGGCTRRVVLVVCERW